MLQRLGTAVCLRVGCFVFQLPPVNILPCVRSMAPKVYMYEYLQQQCDATSVCSRPINNVLILSDPPSKGLESAIRCQAAREY